MNFDTLYSEPDRFKPKPKQVFRLLHACPKYAETPLLYFEKFGQWPLFAKDETARMGLGSFKALGGVYAVAQLISALWKREKGTELAAVEYKNDTVRTFAKSLTFVCASAGNHGLAVASGANIFGAKARIHLASNVPAAFISRLKDKGAEVIISGNTYEESVAAAIADADLNKGILLADGSWKGYTGPPALVMEGYTVLAEEARSQFESFGVWPTHVFLQAGVGGMAAAIAYMIRENWPEQPKIVIVEPQAAPCLRESNLAGKLITVNGPVSNMGRLDCKTPSIISLDVINQCADYFVVISDEDANAAVDLARENGIQTTPSGAAGLAAVMNAERFNLEMNATSYPFIIFSEGIS